MGQQQILLIVIGVIVVGIAVVVGINLYNSALYNLNDTAVRNDLINLAEMAHTYWLTPASLGGGGGNFFNFVLVNGQRTDTTADGVFRIQGAGQPGYIQMYGYLNVPDSYGVLHYYMLMVYSDSRYYNILKVN